jgi:cyclophilin family peptidyl-prolyl cis-trans isomerase
VPQRQKRKTSLRRKSRTPYIIGALVAVLAVAVVGYYVFTSSNSALSATISSSTGATSTATTTCTSANIDARINTTQGSMVVELFPCSAPKTVANIVSLAKSGFYNDLVWHRIVKGFVIQIGDPNSKNGGGTPSTWGQGGSSQTVPLEIDPNLHNDYSYLGMARTSDPNSGSSQFYINLANNTNLDSTGPGTGYTVFGKVISGMNVALAIGNLPVYSQCAASNGGQCWPTDPIQAMILSIAIISGA